MDSSYGYPNMYFNRQHNYYTDNHFYDEFSKEDSQLLLSVLNSTPAQEQNMFYYSPEYYNFMRYDAFYPLNGNETRFKSDIDIQNAINGTYNTYHNDSKMSTFVPY